MKLYDELADWWTLFSHPADYEEEAGLYSDAIDRLARRDVRRVLELGCGGGNNATHMKARYDLTLTDVSKRMLEVSRRQNPECRHELGDMRTLRLGERFDAVFVHDAVMYMTTNEDLVAAVTTAAGHLEPGGVALFVPDDTTETFRPSTEHGGHDGDGRALRYLMWDRLDRDRSAHVDFVIVLEDADGVRVEHDTHRFGLFPRQVWLDLISGAGLQPHTLPYDHSEFDPGHGRALFAGVSPMDEE